MRNVFVLLLAMTTGAFAADVKRPPIVGIANLTVKVSNLEAARKYYGDVLGYQEVFAVKQGGGKPDVASFKVNDRQYLQVSPRLKDEKEDRLIHIGFETTDARQLRGYLAAKGVEVPARVSKDAAGNWSFTVQDPNGHGVEFVQYLAGSLQQRSFGKGVTTARLSADILHVGIFVAERAKADAFYRDVLGFRLMWEGGPEANPQAWISYLVPDGSDWVEYMMITATPNPRQLAGMHHAALGVMDIQKPYAAVVERGYKANKPMLARDGRWLANFYDPDGTRTEFMVRKPAQTPCCTELHDPYIDQ